MSRVDDQSKKITATDLAAATCPVPEETVVVDVNTVPDKPDPFWPDGAVPTHLSHNKIVDAAWKAVGVDGKWRCADCGSTTGKSIRNPQLCANCYRKSVEATKLMQKTNEGWMEQSEQLGLALYERQPEESDKEWTVWVKYRSYYPMPVPTWTALAKELGVGVAFVTKTAQRWAFKARMIAWAKRVDGEGQEKRIKAIREMNDKQLSMAQRLQAKVSEAIDQIDPALLRPTEITNLAKFATELERRVTEYTEEKVEAVAQEAKSQLKTKTKAEDLAEVMDILRQTGVVEGPQVVGIEQKTTILVKEDRS